MRARAWIGIGLLGGLALSCGCLRLEQDIHLRADGSGTFHMQYAVSEQAILQMRAMERLKQELAAMRSETPTPTGTADLMPLFQSVNAADIKAALKVYETNSITVEKVEVDSRGRWQHVSVRGVFGNLAEVAKADFFRDYGFSLFRTREGHYALHRPGRSLDGLPDAPDARTVRMLSPLMAGFRISLAIQTPGAVLKTNGTRSSRSQVQWVFDFDRDPNVLTSLQASPMTVVFDGKGLSLPEIRLAAPDEG